MIKSIKLKSGSSIGQPKLELELTPITVFVGPNNSGKSKILMEIEQSVKSNKVNPNLLVLSNLNIIPMSKSEIEDDLIRLKAPFMSENKGGDHVWIGKLNPQSNTVGKVEVMEDLVIKSAMNPTTRSSSYGAYISLYTLRLDGTNRLNLLREQDAGDMQSSSLNHLAYLFKNDNVRKEVRRIVYEAFGKYYVVDPTNIGKLRVRLSSYKPKSDEQERGWGSESIEFHKEATLMDNASDGVKAFSGIITTLLAGEPKITLIDEPEAFLHPSLSNKLGKEIGTSLRKSNNRLLVSTHSSSFLMGCIQSGAPLNIVRLTYNSGIATSRLLPQDKILHLMRHPLLRSTGVLSALFYESVIVTESDSDRAFYQEINERLLAENDPRAISNCLFINAQNKQTVWDIVKPLRELGIPTVGIVDLDVLKEGGTVFNKLLSGAYVPDPSHTSITTQRKVLLDNLNTLGDWKRSGGITLMDQANNETANSYFDGLDKYGAFVVRNGELESWLKHLGATSHGSTWLINVFEKMGEDPSSSYYLKPNSDDVWAFIGHMKDWIANNDRKGIPS